MKNRWIVASLFVWTLVGAVALAAYSGRNDAPKPVAESQSQGHSADDGHNHTPEELEALNAPKSAPPSAGTALQAPKSEKVAPKPKAIRWETSFENAMRRAKSEGKPIMIDFYTDWCGACKVLDSDVYTDGSVISQSANWVSIKINAEKRTDVAAQYGVKAYPTIVFAESTGKPIAITEGVGGVEHMVEQMQSAYSKWMPDVA